MFNHGLAVPNFSVNGGNAGRGGETNNLNELRGKAAVGRGGCWAASHDENCIGGCADVGLEEENDGVEEEDVEEEDVEDGVEAEIEDEAAEPEAAEPEAAESEAAEPQVAEAASGTHFKPGLDGRSGGLLGLRI